MNGMERSAALVTYLSTIQAHMATHRGLAGPFSVFVDLDSGRANVTVQLDSNRRLIAVAGGLLTWADSLREVTAEAWRVPAGDLVHLSVTGMVGGVSVRAYDATPFDASAFADLEPRQRRPVLCEQLRVWALGRGAEVVA